MTIKFSALRDFLAVAERGSLRAAARHRGSAQSAISRSIHELERELGAVLFSRGVKGVQLTPMGEVFMRRASAVRSELQNAQEELDQMRGETHGHVVVALSTAATFALLPNALGPFRERFPNVKIEIIDAVLPGVETRLAAGSVDCYVGPMVDDSNGGLAVEKLFDNTRVIVCRKGHPLAYAESLKELAEAEWLTTSITFKPEEELGPLFEEHGLPPPRLVMQAHSALTFLVVLANSDLISMLPIQWTLAPAAQGVLQTIAIEEKLVAPAICIVRRNSLPLTPAAEYFCDMVRRASQHMAVLPG